MAAARHVQSPQGLPPRELIKALHPTQHPRPAGPLTVPAQLCAPGRQILPQRHGVPWCLAYGFHVALCFVPVPAPLCSYRDS